MSWAFSLKASCSCLVRNRDYSPAHVARLVEQHPMRQEVAVPGRGTAGIAGSGVQEAAR